MNKTKITKEELISRAGELFHKYGYHKTSIKLIADECNLSKASIYHHTESKQNLILDVIDRLKKEFSSQVLSLATTAQGNSLEKLDQFLTATEDFFVKRKGGCLMGNLTLETAHSSPDFIEVLQSYFDEWLKSLTTLLKEFSLTGDKAREYAMDYLANFQGALMLARLYKNDSLLIRARSALQTKLKPAHSKATT